MKWAFTIIAFLFLVGFGECTQALEFPQPGFRYRTDLGRKYNGWVFEGGGYYDKSTTTPETEITGLNVNETMNCCVDQFSPAGKNPNKMMLVRSKPISRDRKGGIEVSEIVDWIVLEKKRDEAFLNDCELNGRVFMWAVINEKKKTLVGISIDENGFSQYSMNWVAYPCNIP